MARHKEDLFQDFLWSVIEYYIPCSNLWIWIGIFELGILVGTPKPLVWAYARIWHHKVTCETIIQGGDFAPKRMGPKWRRVLMTWYMEMIEHP